MPVKDLINIDVKRGTILDMVDVLENQREEIKKLKALTRKGKCTWYRYTEYGGGYETGCDNMHPTSVEIYKLDESFNFCPYCGQEIKESDTPLED